MNTMVNNLRTIAMMDDMHQLLKDLNVVRQEIYSAEADGAMDDVNMLMRRDAQLCTEVTYYAHHFSRTAPNV